MTLCSQDVALDWVDVTGAVRKFYVPDAQPPKEVVLPDDAKDEDEKKAAAERLRNWAAVPVMDAVRTDEHGMATTGMFLGAEPLNVSNLLGNMYVSMRVGAWTVELRCDCSSCLCDWPQKITHLCVGMVSMRCGRRLALTLHSWCYRNASLRPTAGWLLCGILVYVFCSRCSRRDTCHGWTDRMLYRPGTGCCLPSVSSLQRNSRPCFTGQTVHIKLLVRTVDQTKSWQPTIGGLICISVVNVGGVVWLQMRSRWLDGRSTML